jgi:serine/threonine protein kinase
VTKPAIEPIGVVGHYNLLERLEPAGPGDLFRARDTRLGRTVAVRLLPAAFVSHAGERAELVERARTLITLSHHNVTTLFEVGEHEGRIFFVFEYHLGQSLRVEMAGRHMNVRRAIEIAIQIADAVADAHAAGFVHGGLSPDSIMLTNKGHAKIPALELASRGGFDQESEGLRLHDYDSPEEARGEEADERSDVYSVGAILYEMLASRRPLHRGSAAPSASNERVPPDVDQVVLKAVAPNPNARFQSAALLAAELRSLNAALDARGVGGEEAEPAETTKSGAAWSLIVVAAILLALGGLAWWFAVR